MSVSDNIWFIFCGGVTVSRQPLTAPLPFRLCWVLRLSALLLDCSGILCKDITAESCKYYIYVNCWLEAKKNLILAQRVQEMVLV